jgi:Uma2 family endonuclease
MRLTLNFPQDLTFTDEELFAFCRANPDLRIERDENGFLLIMPPTGLESSFRNNELSADVTNWNRKTRLGRVSDSNGGYTLPDTSMKAPDVAWVSHERLAAVSSDDLKRFAHVCPDFVMELLSENDTLPELQEKMEKYLKNGVRLGWLIDPKARLTHVYRPGREPEAVPFEATLGGGEVMPGFELNVARTLGI